MLDDVTFDASASGGVTVTGITFGARNADGVDQTVDVLVTFFDEANVGATGSQAVESGPLGTVRLEDVLVPAGSTASTFTRTFAGVLVPDQDAAVRITFVEDDTNAVNENVDALLASDNPTVGSSADVYWSDAGTFNQTFTGDEAVGGADPIHANLYLALKGFVGPDYLIADANADGQVNVADLGILATNYNETGVDEGRSVGDFNCDGVVNVADLGILATHYGQPAAPGSASFVSFEQALAAHPDLAAAVPEPGALVLLAPPALLTLLGRRRRTAPGRSLPV